MERGRKRVINEKEYFLGPVSGNGGQELISTEIFSDLLANLLLSHN